jgi:hypothetical protein
MLFATNHPARRRRRREYRVVEFRGAPAIPGPSTTSSLRRGPTSRTCLRPVEDGGHSVAVEAYRRWAVEREIRGTASWAASPFRSSYHALEAPFRKSRTRAWCHSLPQLRPTPNHRRTPRPRQGSPHPIRTHHRDRPPTHRVGRHRHHRAPPRRRNPPPTKTKSRLNAPSTAETAPRLAG